MIEDTNARLPTASNKSTQQCSAITWVPIVSKKTEFVKMHNWNSKSKAADRIARSEMRQGQLLAAPHQAKRNENRVTTAIVTKTKNLTA